MRNYLRTFLARLRYDATRERLERSHESLLASLDDYATLCEELSTLCTHPAEASHWAAQAARARSLPSFF